MGDGWWITLIPVFPALVLLVLPAELDPSLVLIFTLVMCLKSFSVSRALKASPLSPVCPLSFQACLGLEVYEGAESVMLPCQVPEDVYRDATAVVWDRKDLSSPTVHLRLQSGDDLTKQNLIYFNRTSMRADALQTGDFSLTLRKPVVNDTGTYTCTTRTYGQDQSKTHLQLRVAGQCCR